MRVALERTPLADPPSSGIDLLPHKRCTKHLLCAKTIVRAAVKPEKPLVVAPKQSKGPQVLDLEPGSGATPRPVPTSVFTLVPRPFVDALADR